MLEFAPMRQGVRTFASYVLFAFLFLPFLASASGQTARGPVQRYPLATWSNLTCRAKGRFQDREYCSSMVIDRIVADGKAAIPALIAQITDARWIADPVYDFWQRIRAGELAHFILQDLFLDDTWQHSTMPALFPPENCTDPAWACWDRFRSRHSLRDIQARWEAFWNASRDRIYWDQKARCFRLREAGRPR